MLVDPLHRRETAMSEDQQRLLRQWGDTFALQSEATGGASRRSDQASKTSAKSQYLGVAESRREPALQSPADAV